MKKYAKLLETVILVLALAIPAWLFYNFWWGGKRPKKGASSRPMVAVPVSGTVKSGAVAGTSAPQTSTAAAASMPVHVSSPVASAPVSTQKAPADDTPLAAVAGPSASEPSVSTNTLVVSFSMKKGRNPFLSPDDYARIKAEEERVRQEEERRRLEQEIADKAIADRNKIRSLGLPEGISLQGLIGDQAIINGRTISIGQSVNDAKLVKVGIDYVILRVGYRNFYYNMDGKMFEIDRNGKRVKR